MQLLLFPAPRPLAERFGAEFFRNVPESPGVYLMSTARDGVLYVGKAKNLRRRLGSYRSGTGERLSRHHLRLLLITERIDWDLCPDETAALARERELIRALQPRFNSIGVRPPKEWFVGWRRDQDGLTLGLTEFPQDWPESRGPFVYARPAFAALLRSLWLRIHPGTSVVEMPSPLLQWTGPARFSVAWSRAAQEWLNEAEELLAGRESPLLPHTTAPMMEILSADKPTSDSPTGLSFEEQWRMMDVECLLDFHARIPSLSSFDPELSETSAGFEDHRSSREEW